MAAARGRQAHENSAFARWGRFGSATGRGRGRSGRRALLIIITIPLFFITFGQLDAGTDPTPTPTGARTT